MKQDKFLTGILVGVAALVVLSLALFFVRRDGAREYADESAPEGVTHNYILAVLNKDYQKAYGYLAELENKPTYEQFRQSFFNGMVNPANVGVEVGAAEIHADEAVVTLAVYYESSDPFGGRYSSEDRALLVKQNGAWKLSAMPYQFWAYDWYQETPK